MNLKKGFTLIELLVVVAIIAILASIILASLSNARDKGNDAAVKSDLSNAIRQAEVFYNTNTLYLNSYGSATFVSGVCSAGPIGGAKTIEPQVTAAAKASGLASFARNAIGTNTTATCNDSATAWAAEVPLRTTVPAANQFWCVDSTGKSTQETGFSLSATNDYVCQ